MPRENCDGWITLCNLSIHIPIGYTCVHTSVTQLWLSGFIVWMHQWALKRECLQTTLKRRLHFTISRWLPRWTIIWLVAVQLSKNRLLSAGMDIATQTPLLGIFLANCAHIQIKRCVWHAMSSIKRLNYNYGMPIVHTTRPIFFQKWALTTKQTIRFELFCSRNRSPGWLANQQPCFWMVLWHSVKKNRRRNKRFNLMLSWKVEYFRQPWAFKQAIRLYKPVLPLHGPMVSHA